MSDLYIPKQGTERRRAQQRITGDGAITIRDGFVLLSKASAAAITIAAPSTLDTGKVISVITYTAQAHVITSAVDGFNLKGSSGTVTFTAAIGNKVTLEAIDGHWFATGTGITVA